MRSTCTSAARAGRLPAPAPHQGRRAASPCPCWIPSRPSWSPPPKAAKSPPPRPMCAFDAAAARPGPGPRVVPILVDEARTFRHGRPVRQIGIYNPKKGQLYTPVDRDQVMYYREDKAGQILQEGINEAGGMASWFSQPPATAPTTASWCRLRVLLDVRLPAHRRPGLGRGRHAGARLPAGRHLGRTTLNGEGLQHEDGHSHILAGTIPNLRQLRPYLCARSGVICTTASSAWWKSRKNVFLLPDPAERKLRHARLRRCGTESEILKACTVCKPGNPRATNACNCWARHHPARICWRPRPAG